jgi:hypothetical protein
MSHTHHYTAALYLLAFAGLVWLVAWGWFCFMVGRIVRWTYLEKRHDWRSAAEELNSQVHQFHQ